MEKIDRLPWGATELRKPRFSPKQNIFLNRAEGKKKPTCLHTNGTKCRRPNPRGWNRADVNPMTSAHKFHHRHSITVMETRGLSKLAKMFQSGSTLFLRAFKKITLLRVIPTLAFQVIYSDIFF